VTGPTAASTLGHHVRRAWAAVGAVSQWGSARHRRRLATQSFGERAAKGCLWWLIFGWWFVAWRALPYLVAVFAVVFVALYAATVSLLWLVVAGVAVVARRRTG
jgi:hypothetical protein